jgi:DNA-binding transcriptional LysR family regulator
MRRVLAQRDTFDPARARHTFRVAMTDGVGHVLLPALLARLDRAPQVSLEVHAMPEGALADELAAGTFDLAVTHFGELPATVRREQLWLEEYVALVPRTRRLTGGKLSRADYAGARHVFVSPRPGRPPKLVTMLRERGLDPRTVVTVPHFLLLPGLVATSGAFATVARSLATRFEATHAVRAVTLPYALPSYGISQVWHERSDADPAHRWLRGELLEAARHATARPGAPVRRGVRRAR